MTGFLEHWTGLPDADALAERYRIDGTSAQGMIIAQAFTDGRPEPQPKPQRRQWFTDAEVEAIFARWNAPRRIAQDTD